MYIYGVILKYTCPYTSSMHRIPEYQTKLGLKLMQGTVCISWSISEHLLILQSELYFSHTYCGKMPQCLKVIKLKNWVLGFIATIVNDIKVIVDHPLDFSCCISCQYWIKYLHFLYCIFHVTGDDGYNVVCDCDSGIGNNIGDYIHHIRST
jgi:hypothetical protein